MREGGGIDALVGEFEGVAWSIEEGRGIGVVLGGMIQGVDFMYCVLWTGGRGGGCEGEIEK